MERIQNYVLLLNEDELNMINLYFNRMMDLYPDEKQFMIPLLVDSKHGDIRPVFIDTYSKNILFKE